LSKNESIFKSVEANVYQPKVNRNLFIFPNAQKNDPCEQFITFFDPMIYLFAIGR
jgi:hypothetical protein